MTSNEHPAKFYIDANTLLNDAFLLGEMVLQSGFIPNLLIALWRGGTPVAIAIQELLVYRGIAHDHLPVKTRHYTGLNETHNDVVIEGIEPVLEKISEDTRLLVVDDVFDTGITLATLVGVLHDQTAIQHSNLKIATPWFKPGNNRTALRPDYYLHETEHWIVFPHELQGLGKEELSRGKPELPALKNL